MKVTPRKDEVAQVVELLESDTYTSADALAKDVIKRVADFLSERDWYIYAYRMSADAPVLAWGPLSSETEVVRFGKRVGLAGDSRTVKLYSTARLEREKAEAEKGVSRFCADCGHPLGAHQHPRSSGRCAVARCACATARK